MHTQTIIQQTFKKRIMVLWLLTSLLLEVVAVAGVGKCNISYLLTKEQISSNIIFNLFYQNEFILENMVFSPMD